MLVELTELLGRQVYTPEGRLLGEVDNVVVDVDGSKVDGIFVAESSPLLVDDSKPINVPYRWVSAVSDVVLLKYFPKRVSMKRAPARPAAGRGARPRAGRSRPVTGAGIAKPGNGAGLKPAPAVPPPERRDPAA